MIFQVEVGGFPRERAPCDLGGYDGVVPKNIPKANTKLQDSTGRLG